MNKTTAHIIFGVIDLGALVACYHFFSEWKAIHQKIAMGELSITFQGFFGVYLLMMIIPIVHLSSFIKWQGTTKKWANRSLILLCLFMIGSVIVIDFYIEQQFTKSEYRYCAHQSEEMTFSEFRTYLKKDQPCLE